MKSILFTATLFALPMTAMAKKCDPCPCPPSPCFKPEVIDTCEPDLFRKYEQIFSGSAEFLYWTVAEGGLDYALKMEHNAWSSTTPSYAQGEYENATYNLDPGFRLEAHYFRAPHYWEMRWQYTRMTCRGDNHSSKPEESEHYLTGTWPQITTAPLSGAHSHLHFNYNVFDWLVDRVFTPNPHLRLRVLGGTTVAWMNQDWKVQYFDAVPRTTTVRNRWKFVGAGLKSGTSVDWFLSGDFYMTAQGMFGLLIGSYENHSKQTTSFQPTISDDTSVPIRNAKYTDARPAFTTQMIFGPSYQKNFCNSRLELFAGFEMNAWFNLQEIYRSTAALPSEAKETWINSSALALYGLTTRVTYDF